MTEATIKEILDELLELEQIKGVVPRSEAGAPALVPSLVPGVFLTVSPQLAERFLYAASWTGPCSLHFLTTDEMVQAWETTDETHESVAIRREHWTDAAMASHPTERVSLLAVSLSGGFEAYLLWGEGSEPRVVSYIFHQEQVYSDLKDFLMSFIV